MGGLFSVQNGYVKSLTPEAQTQNQKGSVLLSTSIDIIDENGFGIGYITQINDNDARPATKARALGAADAGRAIEHIPGVSDLTMTVTGFALYNRQEDGSVVQRMAGGNAKKAFKMLQEQKIGFKILEVERDPTTGKVTDATEYLDCWFTSKGKPINIGQASIMETANISVLGKVRPVNYLSL